MNGNWFPWSEGVNGNQPGEYVTAWRHVHDIFTAVGADQRLLGLVPEHRPGQRIPQPRLDLPGRRLRRLDLPRRLQLGHQPRPARRLAQLRPALQLAPTTGSSRDRALEADDVSEIGSTEHGGSKAAWIEDMLTRLPTSYPEVRGLLWFDRNTTTDMDWSIETSSSAIDAFASGHPEPGLRRQQLRLAACRRGPPAADRKTRCQGDLGQTSS